MRKLFRFAFVSRIDRNHNIGFKNLIGTIMSLKVGLPPAKSTAKAFYDHSDDRWFKTGFMESETERICVKLKPVPAYLKRQGYRAEEFGDGGAFPEIHVFQYPLGLGKCRSNETLLVTVDAQGNVVFDALVRQNENSNKTVNSQHKDLIPKILKNDEEGDLELEKQMQDTAEETRATIEKIVNVRLSAAQRLNVLKQSSGSSKYIKYRPSSQQYYSEAFNSGAKEDGGDACGST